MAARTTQAREILTPAQALAFVARHGIVCEAARTDGAVSLVDAVAGERVRGSWWAHPRGRLIFALTRAVRAAPDVLVCRLAYGRITFVHRRLWPALVRLADRLPATRLARVHEVHSASGKHVLDETPYPDWVPADVLSEARSTPAGESDALLEACFCRDDGNTS